MVNGKLVCKSEKFSHEQEIKGNEMVEVSDTLRKMLNYTGVTETSSHLALNKFPEVEMRNKLCIFVSYRL